MPKTNERETHEVTRQAVQNQIGLIRNNKVRKSRKQAPARSKSWKLSGMSQNNLRALLDEGTLDRDFNSGRKITLKLKG